MSCHVVGYISTNILEIYDFLPSGDVKPREILSGHKNYDPYSLEYPKDRDSTFVPVFPLWTFSPCLAYSSFQMEVTASPKAWSVSNLLCDVTRAAAIVWYISNSMVSERQLLLSNIGMYLSNSGVVLYKTVTFIINAI